MVLKKGNRIEAINLLIGYNEENDTNCLQLAAFGCGDLYGTNFYKFYGRFEEIGLSEVEAVFIISD